MYCSSAVCWISYNNSSLITLWEKLRNIHFRTIYVIFNVHILNDCQHLFGVNMNPYVGQSDSTGIKVLASYLIEPSWNSCTTYGPPSTSRNDTVNPGSRSISQRWDGTDCTARGQGSFTPVRWGQPSPKKWWPPWTHRPFFIGSLGDFHLWVVDF